MYHRRSVCLHRQRGIAVLLLAWVLLGTMAILLAFAAAKARQTYAGEQLLGGQTERRLDMAAERLEKFYLGHAADMDRNTAAPWTAKNLLVQAGVPPEWRIRIIIGARQLLSPVAWRSIYIWIPPRGRPDTTQYDAATDRFMPAPETSWRQVNGYQLQHQRVEATYSIMQQIGIAAANRFASLRELDPNHNPTTNWFQVGVNQGGYLTLNALGFTQALGLSPAMTRDAWGGTLLASNTIDTNANPPYNMILRAYTPWGGRLEFNILQP